MSLLDVDDGADEPVLDDEQAKAHRRASRGVRVLEARRRAAAVVFAGHRWGLLAMAICVGLPIAVGLIAFFVINDLDITLPLFWGLSLGGLGVFLVARSVLAPKVLVLEQAWLASLGFELTGWFSELSVDPPREGRLLVRLQFRGTPPEAERLTAWLGAVDAERRGEFVFISPMIHVKTGKSGTGLSAHRYLKWQKRLVNRVLKTVHRTYPLAKVTLARATSE